MSSEKPRAVGIYTLGGGMTIGMMEAGFNIIGSMEPNPAFVGAGSHRMNLPDVEHVHEQVDWQAYIDALNEDPPEVVYGSPPCQGLTGFSRAASPDNPKNEHMLHFARAVTEIGPRFAYFENIPRLFSVGRPILDAVTEIGEAGGYRVTAHRHAVADFGVPQQRKRVMVVFEKRGEEAEWPTHPQEELRTVWDVISDLESVEPADEEHIADEPPMYSAPLNEVQMRLREGSEGVYDHDLIRAPDRFRHVPQGKQWTAMPREHWTDKDVARVEEGRIYNAAEPFRVHPDRLSPTITGAVNKLHPTLNRYLTVREVARIMMFPDWWRWERRNHYQQIAAGVCPPVCRWYGSVFAHALDADVPMPVTAGRLF